ncbi:DUF6248 family natural product biosynthesis protein [Streptomyces sp. WAC 01325]|uniref:DUF6248 family natural product biosynthesis protein n=1 Tax=Streptomyces sp. WAC 01325 TaxID=2203202 RepID=UPI00163CAB04|nr:DUF6248 family natural product biosynthesis protein [Streptomyces sp. WAC 01325]
MTTWLRLIGASIMGILDPVPSTVPSPMSEEEAAWVRASVWTKGLRRIEEAYPHGFHRWCSCESGACHPCGSGHHDQCVSASGPRVDEHAGTVTDRGGFVVAVIQYAPEQRPCRWLCPCTHRASYEPTGSVQTPVAQPAPGSAPAASKAPSSPAGQLTLFAGVSQPEDADHADRDAR